MGKLKISFTLLIVFITSVSLMAQDKTFKYVGVKKCKTCHNTKKIGAQYKVWKDGPHANALKSLAGEKSLKYAKDNGIKDPTTDPTCLNCHATAATVDKSLIDPKGKLAVEEGVSCESCHGPGSGYRTMSIMKDRSKAAAKGLIDPTEKVCKTCHNEKNPFHKPFDFKTAVLKIKHPVPK